MLYTIGGRRQYRAGIRRARRGGCYLKRGGGCVWQTEAEARDFLKRHRWRYSMCDVFGVEAEWADTDAMPSGTTCPGDSGIPLDEWARSGVRRLQYDARLVRLR